MCIRDRPYLDGGVADSVPIRHALKSGNAKIIVVLTRNPGYRKKPVSKEMCIRDRAGREAGRTTFVRAWNFVP